MSNELDPRLQDITLVEEITDQFVRENLTDNDQVFDSPRYTYEVTYKPVFPDSIGRCTVGELIQHLEDTFDVSEYNIEVDTFGSDFPQVEVSREKKQIKITEEDRVRYFKSLWRSQAAKRIAEEVTEEMIQDRLRVLFLQSESLGKDKEDE